MIVYIAEVQFAPDQADEVARGQRDGRNRSISQQPGFKTGIWMIDRERCVMRAVYVWESEEAFTKARATLRPEGEAIRKRVGAGATQLSTYELIGYEHGASEE